MNADAICAGKTVSNHPPLSNLRIVAENLEYPEGPVALADGSILVTEIRSGNVKKIRPDGRSEVLARTGGGPNGLAVAPDGALIVCNNGGHQFVEGRFLPVGPAKNFKGGSIQRIDPATATVRTLYTHCGERRLSSPNDLVFDTHGGFYFTDYGKRHSTYKDFGGLYYAMPDGSYIAELAYPMLSPNGIGLSPDQRTLYVADTDTARIYGFAVSGPGRIEQIGDTGQPAMQAIAGLVELALFDSFAVDEAGQIYVGTLRTGHITVIDPATKRIAAQIKVPDSYPTNLCFGGTDRKRVYITLNETGRLAAMDSEVPGLRLNYQEHRSR